MHLKCNLFAFSSISAEYLQRFEFLISWGSVATCLRWGGWCHMGFVANLSHAFQQCKKFENRLRSDKVTESLKVGTFFEAQCTSTALCNRNKSRFLQCAWPTLTLCMFCKDNFEQASHGMWGSAGIKMPIHTHFFPQVTYCRATK